jgi:clan AA aspartic protease
MGTVYAEITLKNVGDEFRVQDGRITEQEIRTLKVRAMVDTGAGTLIINEETRQKLGLSIQGLRRATLADGGKAFYQMTEPVRIVWKNRDAVCRAMVLPDSDEILLGVIPLEDMDLIVDPSKRELTGAHGDEVVCMIKRSGRSGE